MTAEKKTSRESLKNNIIFKIGVIIIIGVLLLIPTSMIRSLITERENTKMSAINEISNKWQKEQTITGPFITIPYYEETPKITSEKNGDVTCKPITKYLHILPTDLQITGTINPETRNRGIFDIIVYDSQLQISGKFSGLNFSEFDIPIENIQFEKVTLSLGISDLQGVKNEIPLKWNKETLSLNLEKTENSIIESGLVSKIKISNNTSASYKFSINLNVKGSKKLYFIPVGKNTHISIDSPWNNPSFNGAFLPDTRTVNDNGFNAVWSVNHINRSFPQKWIGNIYDIQKAAFGVNLKLPVDNYQKSMRSIKYSILFIGLTFIVFFFVEITKKIFIHPIQYFLVGIALVVFYTLLLSISEHLNFNTAFLISAISTLLLIVGYVKTFLKSNMLTLLIGGILTTLYIFIFVIIQLQEYALLIGSIGIFTILGLVMFFTRKIDWYQINIEER